ncbi:MAG: hypothetical protein NUV35_02510, partial [Syntrophomonadaceae bacterium]|nr:hypothetical protein [Syntrophomonadaceae bacterium]
MIAVTVGSWVSTLFAYLGAAGSAQQVREALEQALQVREAELKAQELEQRLRRERIDVTLPGLPRNAGRLHPLTQVTEEILAIFSAMGFGVEEGPEV